MVSAGRRSAPCEANQSQDACQEKLEATPAQVAIAWLLKKSPVMLPIPGTNNLAHLEENVAAAKLVLGDADL